MEHQLGRIDLIRWQGRRSRGPKSGHSPWMILFVLAALVGGSTLAVREVYGKLPWFDLLIVVSAGLCLLAAGAQILILARALIVWIFG